ncbi:MAG: hypothetical protein P8K83_02195, partial [Woeseiaceae bacterium]|nr:hypothetical protein [Woeseiaceae bacterium]
FPIQLTYIIGTCMELFYTLFRIKREPAMTRFIARQLSCSHWYNIAAAKRDLNYEATVSIEEGMQVLEKSLRVSK